MVLTYIKQDLFDTSIGIIVHGCNSYGVMGSGVARLIKDKYPEAYQAYNDQYTQKISSQGTNALLPLGTNIIVPSRGKIIVNAITQETYGKSVRERRYVSYDAVAKCMASLEEFCILNAYPEVAMPKIGAGLGGGDWNVIAAIIGSELIETNVTVYEI